MIYVLIITALIIINFTNTISKIQNKEYINKTENFILNNYKVIFIDVNKNLIKQINDKGSYTVKSLDIYGSSEEKIENVEAIDLTDQEKVRNALFDILYCVLEI